jgi:FMN-dependent NADH-azoreductase
MRVLHVVATPRQERSNTLRVARAFLDRLALHHPHLTVEELDLFRTDLPALARADGRSASSRVCDNIDAKYTLMSGQPLDSVHEASWRQIEALIAQFLGVDAYVLSVPMWNFGIPYALKYYIDCIVQPGYVFRYGDGGVPTPLVLGKKMVCVAGRGGDYSADSPLRPYDFQEPYLRSIFGFIGIADLEVVHVQPTDVSALREAALATALEQARSLADSPQWTPQPVGVAVG